MKGKGNDGTGNNISRDLWRTKQELFDILNNQYYFTFDCCADQDNKKCDDFSDDFESSTEFSLISHICWMNPPFSKAREMFEHFFRVTSKGVSIFRCDNMETRIWQEVILKNASWVFIPKGRWSYTPFDVVIRTNKQEGCRFPSALIGFNVPPIKDIEGVTLYLK
jgi:hypothetical protein